MSVKVAIRVRPFNQREEFLGCISCVQMKQNTTVVHEVRGKDKKQHYFTFDYSFWSHDSFKQQEDGLLVPIDSTYVDQKKVYQLLGQQILENAWVGFNCCLFAYGQTGAGKSYSMIGYGINRGIIPMACDQLFQRIRRFEKKGQREYQVTISMLEIYNQKVQDLFISTNKRPTNGLKVRENKALGVYVQGLNKFPVSSYKEIEKKMEEGSKNRSLASTLMNEYSSRAHTIVMLEFIQKEWITNKKMTKKTSLINLVDLAGSQRVSKTGVGDNKDRLKEASLINKSLHTLGRVIEALAEQSLGKAKVVAIPYRQSALTRILQNALGGNSKTTMICAISPANDNCEETLSTLRYADKTKKIKNKPVVNESEVDKLIRQLREQNQRLKKMLESADDEKNSPTRGLLLGRTQSEIKESKSNMRASIRQIQKQIRKNLQSFAINTDDMIEEADAEQSIMMTEFIDLQDPSMTSEFQTSFTSTTGKSQVYITNLNEDEILNFKVKYSCEKDLLITNNSRNTENLLDQETIRKVKLCGLGIQENHAKITKDSEGKYFIEALSETASQYTLLNGKPVYSKQELKHNDRIILGTNSIFLFKNNTNPEERKDKKYTNEKAVGYQFAINERQQQMEGESPLFYSPGRRRPSNQVPALEDKELLIKLEQIEEQFSRMLEENQRKTREKQTQYKHRLHELQREKEMKEAQKINLESKLNQKKEETYKLKSKELQIEKLQKKLAKFQEEKTKRKIVRQSMLLDGLDNDNCNDVFDPKDFMDLQGGDNTHEFGIGTDPNPRSSMRKQTNPKGKPKKSFYDVVLQQYDDKDNESALGTTNTNSIQNQESYFANQNDMHQGQAQNMMKKNPSKKPITQNQQALSETEQLERYNKIVKVYLDKIKHRICLFTKQYDLTIYSQKLNSKQQQMEEFNCEINGGIHFCRHCKKAIHSKVQHIQYHQNRYQYNTITNNSSEKQSPKRERQNQSQNQFLPLSQQLKITGLDINQVTHEHKRHEIQQKSNEKSQKVKINKSNLFDQLQVEYDERQNIEKQKSRRNSDSIGHNDDSLLLNGTQIDIDQKQEKSKNVDQSHSEMKEIQPEKIPSNQVQEIKKSQTSNQKKNDVSDNQQKREIGKSQFVLDFEEQQFNEIQTPKQNTSNQLKEDSILQIETPQELVQQKIIKPTFTICPQTVSQISLKHIQPKQLEQIKQISKPECHQVEVQTEIIQEDKESFEIKPKKGDGKTKFLQVDFDFSVSDIEEGDQQNSVEQSLNLSSLNNFKEQELANQIQLLKEKIKRLEGQNSSEKENFLLEPTETIRQTEDYILEDQDESSTSAQKIRRKLQKYEQKSRIEKAQSDQQAGSPKASSKSRKMTELPSTFSDKEFLRRKKSSQGDLQKQLESNILICNNENIINERNLSIRKRKREVEELRKTLIKKQRIELQKQLFMLIPMIEKFNLMAKEMNRLIEARVEIEYRNFSHYEIIEALRNFTKSKWKKDSSFSNVQIKVVVANLEQARIYKWAVEVFKNRFQIAQQVFQKYIQNDGDHSLKGYKNMEQDKGKDPFWDPVDFVPSGFGYLAIECMLYNISFEGQISFVFNSKLIGKAFISIIPVKVKKRGIQTSEQDMSVIDQRGQQDMQISNPRNYLQDSLFFTISIQTVTFFTPSRENTSSPLKFTISYDLLMDDYKTETYSTPEIDFKSYEEDHEVNYLRRHCFKEVSQSTLAYISDCPIKLTLNLMKDYNEECLNSSFNQDLERSIEETSSLHDTSVSSIDISKELENLDNKSFKTPDKSLNGSVEMKKLDFSKKEKRPAIYENTELLDKIDKDCQVQEHKRKQKRQKLFEKEAELRGKKDKLKKDDKDCTIY